MTNQSMPTSDKTILEVKNISVSFGGVKPVQDVSFKIAENSFTSVIGPNGAGKTSLFNLISGMNKINTGEIIFNGEAIHSIHTHKIAQKGLIRTFQGAKIIKRLTVAENLMMAVQGNPGDNLSGFFRKKARREFEESARAEALRRLDQVGLIKFADEYAGILSGGQRKLLDLSRALMAKPSMLLLDEPFAGVNPTLVEKLLTVLAQLRKEHAMTFLLIEHDLETVMNISDRVIVMADGKIIADGLPNSIYENELVIDAYLGSRRKDAQMTNHGSGEILFSIEDLQGGYGDIQILNGVNIKVPEKSIVTIVGPNGAGKSTILKAIYGIANVTAGKVTLRKGSGLVDVLATKPHNLSRVGVGYVPQIENIFPALSIDENLEVGFVDFEDNNMNDIRDDLYSRYPDLKKRFKDRAGTLSGGQRQMLAMARALMSSPNILLLDEPSAGLAPALVDQLFDELVKINETGVSILMVEQNARRALAISDYGYVLDMGRNRHEGIGANLVNDPEIVGIYLGKK